MRAPHLSRCARLVLGIALGASISLRAPPALATDVPREQDVLDDIELLDGTHARGRVIRSDPGRSVSIETEDGRRRTFAWEVVREVSLAPEARAPQAVRQAWRARTRGGLSYELRAELSGTMMPGRTFGLTGTCATGTGEVAASIYGQSATAGGRAAGGGIGGRLDYMKLSVLEPDVSSWWGAFRVGTGLDLQLMYTSTPVGIAPVAGELCTEVAATSHKVATASSSVLMARIPLSLGGHLAFGTFDDLRVWRGVVLGAAWSPSWVLIGPWTSIASSHFLPLGVELTIDFTTLHATQTERRIEPHFRTSVFLAAPARDDEPLMGTLGVGAVWY